MIFGHVCSDSDLGLENFTVTNNGVTNNGVKKEFDMSSFKKTVENFSSHLPKIEDFVHRDNHPLYGTSYHNSVEKMYNLIMEQVKTGSLKTEKHLG